MSLKERLTGALKIKWAWGLLVPLILLGLAAITAVVDFCCYHGRIYPEIYLNEIPVGGLKFAEAEAKLAAELFSLEEITLTGMDDGVKTIPLSSLGITWDREKTMAAIRKAGAGGPGYAGRLRRLWTHSPLQLKGKLKVKTEILEQALVTLAEEIEEPPREAAFTVKGTRVIIEKEQEGRFLRVEELRRRLLAAIIQGHDEVALPIETKPAKRSAAMLAGYGVDRVMVSFSTTVSPALPDRVHNIRLGASTINGYLLAPGELFSFSAIIGETTREKGYREAPVIVGEELLPGLGGGLCQVSSTLYNAALLANLTIIERSNHSIAIDYLPIGRDATISIGEVDLKFKNNRDHHILIGAELQEGQLTFRLFGPPMEEQVEIVSSDIVRVEPPVRYEKSELLPTGKRKLVQQGKPGYSVKTWRVVYRNEEEISRELLSHDYYQPTASVYQIGTGRLPTDPAEGTETEDSPQSLSSVLYVQAVRQGDREDLHVL